MTTILANVIEDSVSEEGIRLTTMLLRYPRFIHAEVMTHRVFSRNASSSRAIPVERMINDILKDTAIPLIWTKNQPGMQGYEECNESISYDSDESMDFVEFTQQWECYREQAWNNARDAAIASAYAFHRAGYHKQIINRLLEPFMHINVLVTATDWENFFALRAHEAAEPHIQMLARIMQSNMEVSKPKLLHHGEWHLPFVGESDEDLDTRIKMSVARCARTSYLTHDGRKPNRDEDIALYDRLVGSEPLHASPAEHQATPDRLLFNDPKHLMWDHPTLHGNFRGWKQYRKTLLNENISSY